MGEVVTLLNDQVSFCGSSKYNNEMLKKLHMKIQIQIKIPTSQCYIMRAHIIE